MWLELAGGDSENQKQLKQPKPSGHQVTALSDGVDAHWSWGEPAIESIDWDAWDALLHSSGSASVFLESRMVQALLAAPDRYIAALQWFEADRLVGLACVEDTCAESINLDGHLQSERPWFGWVSRRLHGKDGRFQFGVRVVGTVLGSGEHGQCWSKEIAETRAHALLSQAVFQPLKVNGQQVPRVVMVKDHPLLDQAPRRVLHPGWIPLEFDPEMIFHVNPDWKDFDDYMADLKTKSRTKIKRILTLSEGFVLREWTLDDLQERAEELIALYRRVYERSGFRLGSLHAAELVTSKERWGEDFVVTGYELDGELRGFQCAYVGREETEAFFVGFDPELLKSHAIYQRMLVEFICLGVRRKSTRVNMGRTALEIKSSVGALPRRLQCEVRFRNPLFHAVVSRYARGYTPVAAKLRQPWKADAKALSAHSEVHSF